MILSVEDRSVDVLDADDCGSLAVHSSLTRGGLERILRDLGVGRLSGDRDHALLDVAVLRALARASSQMSGWDGKWARMIDYAQREAWVTADGLFVRAHIEDRAAMSSRGSTIPIEVFREHMAHVPTAVVAIAAAGPSGPTGMVVGTFGSVSLDPVLVGFFADRGSTTFPKIRETKWFCANVLAEHQMSVCRALASKGDHKFDDVSWSDAPSGSPILEGVSAWFDCRIESVHPTGDHVLALASVHEQRADPSRRPLLFHRGRYGSAGAFDPADMVKP